MALESAWQPLMVEKFFQEEEQKEEKSYLYPLSRDIKNNVENFFIILRCYFFLSSTFFLSLYI